MKVKKLLAVILTAAILLGLCACKEKNNPRPSNYVIGEDDPWYVGTIITFEDMLKSDDFNGRDTVCDVIDDQLMVVMSGEETRGDFTDGLRLGLFRMSGAVSCFTTFLADPDSYKLTPLGSYAEDRDKIAVLYMEIPPYTGTATLYKIVWDTDSNTVSEPEIIDIELEETINITFRGHKGDYIVFVDEPYGYHEVYESVDRRIWILNKDKVVGKLKLKDTEFPEFDLSEVDFEDDRLKLRGASDFTGGNDVEISYDTVSGSFDIEKVTSDTQTLNGRKIDGHEYLMHSDGIYKDGELYLSFIDYGVKPEVSYSELIHIDEERVVLLSNKVSRVYSTNDIAMQLKSSPSMFMLEKVPQNPNAGKTVINALSLEQPDDAIIEGIIQYNNAANDYFIRCRVESLYPDDPGSLDSMKNRYNEVLSLITSEAGPDIVFNSHLMPELDGDMFMDLKHKIKMSKREYFTGVSDMCKVNGKLYYIPLNFTLKGIIVNDDYLEKGQTGFTYDEYDDLIENEWNGDDPLTFSCDTDTYLNNRICSLGRPACKKGKFDVDQKGFREDLDFIKEHVPDKSQADAQAEYETYLSLMYNSYDEVYFHALYTNIFVSLDLEGYTACGIPSSTRRGPSVSIISSVSVCSKTGMKGACIEFVDYLLEPDTLVTADYVTINKETLKTSGADADYIELVESAESVEFVNSMYKMILLEQVKAYISGAQDMDQTIAAINEDLDYVFAREE